MRGPVPMKVEFSLLIQNVSITSRQKSWIRIARHCDWCVCVNSKYFYVSSKRKSPASMCDVSKPIVCIIRIFFSHPLPPPPPLACLSAGRLDFGDGWFVKKHRQVTLLFSYVLADSRTFLIPPCATHENPFPLEGLPMQLTGPFFFLLFFPFPSSFIFYSMVAG